MSVKTTGLEFKRFYQDSSVWVDGMWHDDLDLVVDGKEYDPSSEVVAIGDTAKVTVVGGCVFLPGDDDTVEITTLFKRWRRAQTHSVMVIEVPNERVDAVKASLAAVNVKVLA